MGKTVILKMTTSIEMQKQEGGPSATFQCTSSVQMGKRPRRDCIKLENLPSNVNPCEHIIKLNKIIPKGTKE